MDVGPGRHRLDVQDVERGCVSHGKAAATGDLPEAGHPREDREARVVLRREQLDFPGQHGSRPDQRHLAQQDVDQLRELVEARAAQPPSEWCHPGVVGQLVRCGRVPIRRVGRVGPHRGDVLAVDGVVVVHGHGAELQHRERDAVTADAHLAEERRATARGAHGDRDQCHQRTGGDDGRGRHEHVDRSLRAWRHDARDRRCRLRRSGQTHRIRRPESRRRVGAPRGHARSADGPALERNRHRPALSSTCSRWLHTCWTCSSLMCGNIGSDSMWPAACSATGSGCGAKSRYGACRWHGTG